MGSAIKRKIKMAKKETDIAVESKEEENKEKETPTETKVVFGLNYGLREIMT
jgi:hypothetical protein